MLARLFQQRSQARIVRFEEQAVPGTSLDDLSSTLWQPLLGSHTEDPRLTLNKLKILTDDDGRESRELSGRDPIFRLIDDTELLLTIFSAELPNQIDPPAAAGTGSR